MYDRGTNFVLQQAAVWPVLPNSCAEDTRPTFIRQLVILDVILILFVEQPARPPFLFRAISIKCGHRNIRAGGAVKDLNVTWERVEACLLEIPGVRPAGFKVKFDQGMFYHIRYEPGEVVMAKGMYSDYAGVLMSGRVRVLVGDDQPVPTETDVPNCWRRPGKVFRRVEQWVLDRTDRFDTAVRQHAEREEARKKKAEQEKAKRKQSKPEAAEQVSTEVKHAEMEGDTEPEPAPQVPWGAGLARRIRKNWWFRRGHEKFRLADHKLAMPLERAIHEKVWQDKVRESRIAVPPDNSKLEDVEIFTRIMGLTSATWNQPRSATLVADLDEALGPCEMILMNRKALLLIAEQSEALRAKRNLDFHTQVLPDVLRKNRLFAGLDVSGVDFAVLAQAAEVRLKEYEKGKVIVRQDQVANDLALMLNGTVRVSRDLVGGASLVEHLNEHDYFGIACVQEKRQRGASVTAVTDVNVVTIPRQALLEHFFIGIPGLEAKLNDEWEQLQQENRDADELRRLPRGDPPEHLVPKLMQARNLLRINMDLCTRCDQCVRACAETHDGVSRFHRANADLRFGKWEIAAACVHCINAPCQSACPVGAITFLPDGMVQIHRSRCISCQKCVDPCPFNVIEMLPRISPEDAPVVNAKTGNVVATKCDLCLAERREPPCVHACPYGAAERGAPGELFPGLKQWLELPQPESQ